ncbi:hypothetical protein V1477_017268 [Vespula maculifrons]|uniref:Uncharacterized protein n=1 Tax=Vespula maculifrons TaxID=7453 RepID=A0ABD2B5I3_VESMC
MINYKPTHNSNPFKSITECSNCVTGNDDIYRNFVVIDNITIQPASSNVNKHVGADDFACLMFKF